jgi:chromate reductase
MANPRNVAVLVGSLRKDSINRKVATALRELAPASLKLEIIEIGRPRGSQPDREKSLRLT